MSTPGRGHAARLEEDALNGWPFCQGGGDCPGRRMAVGMDYIPPKCLDVTIHVTGGFV